MNAPHALWMKLKFVMELFTVSYLSGIIIFLSGVGRLMAQCPVNISAEVSTCLTEYNTFSKLITDQPTRLFTGVDVEVVRNLCSMYRPATMCLTRLQIECPKALRQINIETDHMLLLDDICSRRDLYELYALQQSCFFRSSMVSSQCYSDFRVNSESNWVSAIEGKNKAVKHVCKNYDILVSCIETNVKNTCGPESTELIGDLVMPTIKIAHVCLSIKLAKLIPTTRAAPKYVRVTESTYKEPSNPNYSVSTGSFVSQFHNCRTLFLSCLLTVSLLYS